MIRTAKDNTLLNENNRWDDLAYLTNISSCIWLSNMIDIIKNTFDNEEDISRCINLLNKKVKEISSYRIMNIQQYKTIYEDYTSKFLNDSIGAVEQFITDCKNMSISKYFNVKYIGSKRQWAQRGNRRPKNIIVDFNGDYFLNNTGRLEDIVLYPTCYCHYFMIAFLLDIINSAKIEL